MTPLYQRVAALLYQALEAPGGIVVRCERESDQLRAIALMREVQKKLRSEALRQLTFRKSPDDASEIWICKIDARAATAEPKRCGEFTFEELEDLGGSETNEASADERRRSASAAPARTSND